MVSNRTPTQGYPKAYLTSLWLLQHYHSLPQNSKLRPLLKARLFLFMKRQLVKLKLFPLTKQQ